MWLGARRAGHALLSALAYPAMGLLLLTLLLAYSRGALVALASGARLWFCLVPLRLRGAAVLLSRRARRRRDRRLGLLATTRSSSEKSRSPKRTSAGHELGALVLAMVVVLDARSASRSRSLTGRRAPLGARPAPCGRRAGRAARRARAGVRRRPRGQPPGLHRHDLARRPLADRHAREPVPNTPGRLTAIASVRAQYWNEALKVFKAHPALGAGARRATKSRACATAPGRCRSNTPTASSCRRLADLGIVGLLARARPARRPGWRPPDARRTRSTAAGALGESARRRRPAWVRPCRGEAAPLRAGADRAC